VKTSGFAGAVRCPRCGKWARISTSISIYKNIKSGISVITCKHCGYRKEIRSLKEI